jgi:CRP-like cAMP-binding protein
MSARTRPPSTALDSAISNALDSPISNDVLAALPSNERDLLFPQLTLKELSHGERIQGDNQPIEFVYFLNSGTVSVLAAMADGKTVEVGMIGKEGLVGLPGIFGVRRMPHRVIVVQIRGSAFRVGADDLGRILVSCPVLRSEIERYSQELMLQVAQTAACNTTHQVEQRLARWLLMSADRHDSTPFAVTHEVMAGLLGTNRATVSLAAEFLKKAGLINHTRGSVQIADRAGLEAGACECYRALA